MSAASGTTLVATGMLPMLVMTSAALTAPVSLFLLSRYRRAVLRSMTAQARPAAGAGAPPVTTLAASDGTAPAQTLRVIEGAPADSEDPPLYRQARRSLVSATSIYVVAGLVYAVVLTSAYLFFTWDTGVAPARFLWLLSCYAWPTALAVGMIVAVSWRQRLAVGLAYLAMLFAVAIYAIVHNPELSVRQVAFFWAFTNAPATILLLAFLHRRVRAVGPLVLSFMVIAVLGSQVLLSAAAADDAGLHAALAVGALFGLGGTGVFYGLMLLGFVLFGVLGWFLLKWLGRRYQARRMSDQSLTLDAMWLLFAVVQSITFAFQGWMWLFTGLAAFIAYKLVCRIGFTLTGVARPAAPERTLLLLRVFALGARSERLFDALSKRWLRAGSISMIAGPDLVTATVEPHEFLEFMGGELSRRFVRGGEDLERRLAAADRGPDPDGRYRVNEFFCYADTWQETMVRLAAKADAVIMDLRGFSPANQGCLFELQHLVDAVDLTRVVFLFDENTDRAFLLETLQQAWRAHERRSQHPLPPAEARLVRVGEDEGAEVKRLLKLLFVRHTFRTRIV
jgi:hypothetical protein